MQFVTLHDTPLRKALEDVFSGIKSDIESKAGLIMGKRIKQISTIHISRLNWRHADTKKIKVTHNLGTEAEVTHDIAGLGRAYHNVEIKPVRKQFLAIPIYRSAYGKKPADFKNLFIPKGRHFLA